MNGLKLSRYGHALLICLAALIATGRATAGDNAQLLAVTITNGTVMLPRTVINRNPRRIVKSCTTAFAISAANGPTGSSKGGNDTVRRNLSYCLVKRVGDVEIA